MLHSMALQKNITADVRYQSRPHDDVICIAIKMIPTIPIPPWQPFLEPWGIFHHAVSVRLVDTYTKCQQKDVKEEIIQSFRRCLQIVIATIAFGIGLNCPDIQQVVHWEVSNPSYSKDGLYVSCYVLLYFTDIDHRKYSTSIIECLHLGSQGVSKAELQGFSRGWGSPISCLFREMGWRSNLI